MNFFQLVLRVLKTVLKKLKKKIFKNRLKHLKKRKCFSVLRKPGQIARSIPIGSALKTFETRGIFWARKLCLLKKNKKIVWSTNLQSNRLNNEKAIVNSKYYCEHQCTCDNLMFMYLMISKLLHLLMNWEAFNSFMTEVPII